MILNQSKSLRPAQDVVNITCYFDILMINYKCN